MRGNLHIAVLTTRSRGWLSVSADSEEWPAGRARVRLLHWGHKKPYLGVEGWQVAETWCDLEDAFIENGRSCFLMPPQLTRWLDTGSNYELTLEVAGSRVLQQAIPWRISSRRASPEVVTAALEQTQAVLGTEGIRSSESEHVPVPTYELEEAWARACLIDSPVSYKPFLSKDGPFAERARYELAHFLPSRVSVRFEYGRASPAYVGPSINLSSFLLDAADQARADRDFVSGFAKESVTDLPLDRSTCNAVVHRGSTQGKLGSVVETVDVDFELLPKEICSLAFTVSLFPGTSNPALLGLQEAELKLIDIISGEALLALDIPRRPGVAGAYAAQLLRRDGAWRLKERDDTFVLGLEEICAHFGLAVTEGG